MIMTKTTEPVNHPARSRLSGKPSLLDGIWLVALAVYILAGTASTPFHGDEAMQITMSRDYFTAFVNHQPQALVVSSPYGIDSPEWLRLINGSINLYAIGFSLQTAGYGEQDLPPLWQWPLSYDENVTRGSRPTQAMLVVSRVSSAVFLALSSVVLFGIGWQLRGRLTAVVASGLYALNPVILLNGRRAMMEGSTLFFGLLAILVAILICRQQRRWYWWVTLGVVCGLTLASKHSGIVFVGSVLGWIVVTRLVKHLRPDSDGKPRWLRNIGQIGISVVMMVMVFEALSPAQWNNPAARFGDLVSERAKLLESQVKAEPSAPTHISERVLGIVTQPYLQAPVYFEAAFWAGAKPIQDEITQYDPSVWSGWHTGAVIGGILTLLAGLGIIGSIRGWRRWQAGLLVWLAVVAASLMVNPLPWQRYYLALFPVTSLLTAIGISMISEWWHQVRSST